MPTSQMQELLKNGIPDVAALKRMLFNDPTDQIIVGDEVKFHTDAARKDIVLPQGFGFEQAKNILERKHQEQEEPTEFSRVYSYRYDDGVYATNQVMKARYGLTLARGGMFRPAETREVTVGLGKTVTCAAGLVEIPTLADAGIYMSSSRHRQHGVVFELRFGGPRKHMDEVKKFFDDVEEYLRLHSIYRGHALAGASTLEFMNPFTVDRRQVVFAGYVEEALSNLLFGPIRNTELYRREGIGLKRALLFHGPFGTGKTSIGMIAAQEAEANGWTFITARPEDKIQDVLQTAKLYQPAVVLVEDVETESANIKTLLDAFDGATAKGTDIILLLTTNHIENVEKGLMRPGRIDATVHVAELDAEGVERLIKVVVNPRKLADDVDYGAVYEQMTGFLPAFVRAAIDRAKTWALNVQGADYVLDTGALAGAATSLHDQLRLMAEAMEGKPVAEIETAMRTLVESTVVGVVNSTLVADNDGDFMGSRLGVKEGAELNPDKMRYAVVR